MGEHVRRTTSQSSERGISICRVLMLTTPSHSSLFLVSRVTLHRTPKRRQRKQATPILRVLPGGRAARHGCR
jgi:hypothetical protein